MRRRPLGHTGIEVSILGLGGGQLGDPALDEAEADRLLGAALELGVTLIDSAPSYGRSEERIGRLLAARRDRRDQIVLSTKGGYGAPGAADWTGAAISAGVEAALRRLQTDRIDLFHLHSCPAEVALRDDILGALAEVQRRGLVRVVAYSGENADLDRCVDSGRFGAVQTSVSPFDQRGLAGAVARAAAAGLGVIGKRPLGNAPWRFSERPVGDYAEAYWARMRRMGLDLSPGEWLERALRFSAFAPGVSAIITGTRSAAHLRQSAALVARGPLPEEELAALRGAFAAADEGWTGQI